MAEQLTSEQIAAQGGGTEPKKNKSKAKSKKPNGRAFLSAVDIFQKKDIKEEELYIPEWDGFVKIRGLTSAAHEKLVQSAMETDQEGARQFNMIGYQAKLACACTFDDEGHPVFNKPEHVAMLMKKASGPVSSIAKKVQELSGLEADAVKRLRENLEKTPNAGSPSA